MKVDLHDEARATRAMMAADRRSAEPRPDGRGMAEAAIAAELLGEPLRGQPSGRTEWLLFAVSVAIGLGYFFGPSGDAAQLVSRHPETCKAYDIATDAIAAGMSFVHAATARRRTASFSSRSRWSQQASASASRW